MPIPFRRLFSIYHMYLSSFPLQRRSRGGEEKQEEGEGNKVSEPLYCVFSYVQVWYAIKYLPAVKTSSQSNKIKNNKTWSTGVYRNLLARCKAVNIKIAVYLSLCYTFTVNKMNCAEMRLYHIEYLNHSSVISKPTLPQSITLFWRRLTLLFSRGFPTQLKMADKNAGTPRVYLARHGSY